jgi:hypothetical protein
VYGFCFKFLIQEMHSGGSIYPMSLLSFHQEHPNIAALLLFMVVGDTERVISINLMHYVPDCSGAARPLYYFHH